MNSTSNSIYNFTIALSALISTSVLNLTGGMAAMPSTNTTTVDPIQELENRKYAELNRQYECKGKSFKFETFLDYMTGVSVLMILVYCFLKVRAHRDQGFWNGRPGLCYPIKLIEESHDRFIYVAAFAVTAWSMYLITTEEVSYSWTQFVPRELNGITKLLNCILIGILYYPIFGGLSSHHWIGYILGGLYTLTMAICFVLTAKPCDGNITGLLLIDILQFIPILVFYAIICIYFVILLIKLVLNRKTESVHYEQEIDANSKAYRKVKNLMRKTDDDYNPFEAYRRPAGVTCYGKYSRGQSLEELLSSKTRVQRVKSTAKTLALRKIYANSIDFQYSTSVLTAVALSLLILYIILLKAISRFVSFEWYVKKRISIDRWAQMQRGDPAEKTLEEDLVVYLASMFLGSNMTDQIAEMVYGHGNEIKFWVKAIRGIYLFSVVLTFGLCALQVLDILRKYKRDLLLMQRGIYEHIPRRIDQSPVSIVRGALKFTGYQAGFAASGFVLMMVVILLLTTETFVFAAVIFRYGKYWILLYILNLFWPLALFFIMIYVSQFMLIRFYFLVKKDGKFTLALDNRHFFFNVQFFMVFINAALGLLSSILTILKSVFFGIWTLPRLDMSAFPRTFEKFDPGFSAYCSMLKLDHTQRNQVLLVFTCIMLNGVRRRNAKAAELGTGARKYVEKTLRRERIRQKWALAVTLSNNPGLNLYRKLENVAERENENKRLEHKFHPQTKTTKNVTIL